MHVPQGLVRLGWAWTLAVVLRAPAVSPPKTLAEVAEEARLAWLAHKVRALVGPGDSVVLRLRGPESAVPLGPEQTVQLLEEYLRPATERSLEIQGVRPVGQDRGYVELVRRYVVQGTSDEIRETVFLGFRRVGQSWHLSAVRVTPSRQGPRDR